MPEVNLQHTLPGLHINLKLPRAVYVQNEEIKDSCPWKIYSKSTRLFLLTVSFLIRMGVRFVWVEREDSFLWEGAGVLGCLHNANTELKY